MDNLAHRVSSKIFEPSSTPATSITIKVKREALRSVVNKGLKKTSWIERCLPVSLSRWVNVEAAEHGTDDSIFFVPEHPNVDHSHARTLPAEYIKINPAEHDDVVHHGDDFEVSFVGMSVAPMDVVGNNEILLCSLTREANSTLELETKPEQFLAPSESAKSTSERAESVYEIRQHPTEQRERDDGMASGEPTNATAGIVTDKRSAKPTNKTVNAVQGKATNADTHASAIDSANMTWKESAETDNVKQREESAERKIKREKDLLAELPTALTIQPQDIPFLHYDPNIDGHDAGSTPDSFVPIPGSKRVYLQRRGDMSEGRDVAMRFTVIEVDMLSEEQLIAIKSLDEIGKSVGKAAATVPYLKFISWILKFANFLGRSALKKVAEPEHVLSKDMVFLLADRVENEAGTNENICSQTSSSVTKREQYGNYLRYGYYFFLSATVDAKLYAQTGASSQNVPLLLRRSGYKARFALKNEREFFPMSGVSYVAVKVTRGCSPLDRHQRVLMKERHRKRLVKLLKKYTGKLENAVD